MEPGWLQIKSAAQWADISTRTIRRWLASGLPHSRVGGVILIERAKLDEWIRGHAAGQDLDQIASGMLAEL